MTRKTKSSNIISVRLMRKHISAGQRLSPSHDPLSLAMRDAGLNVASVGPKRVTLMTKKGLLGIPLPVEASKFLADYDAKLPIRVLRFKLDLTKGMPVTS
jgi:hypothetical protein